MPEVSSGGVGLIDFDGDGWLDVYVAAGRAVPAAGPDSGTGRRPSGDRLFRNRGDGTFEDVTESSGLRRHCPRGMATAWPWATTTTTATPTCSSPAGGRMPSITTAGDGTFEDVTAAAGLGGDRDWPTSAAFADLDNDGDLDLYVCHYLKWDADHPRLCQNPSARSHTSVAIRSNPQPLPDHRLPQRRGAVHRRDRRRRVSSTATAAGWASSPPTSTTTTAMDLFVANDLSANYLFRNLGGFRFEEQGLTCGSRLQCRTAAIRRAWASPPATSTATAGPTWP